LNAYFGDDHYFTYHPEPGTHPKVAKVRKAQPKQETSPDCEAFIRYFGT
jgi:hypothetical protein